jgi:hypothetical protein
MAYPRANYQDALFRELTVFFHRALASYHGDRYQDAAEAVEQLKVILELADETKPYLFSSSIPYPIFTDAKQRWRRSLSFLKPGQHVFNLYVRLHRKSTLVKPRLVDHREEDGACALAVLSGKTAEMPVTTLLPHQYDSAPRRTSRRGISRKETAGLVEIDSRQHTPRD